MFAEYSDVWLRARKVKGQPLQESTKRGDPIWLGKYRLPTFEPATSASSSTPIRAEPHTTTSGATESA